VAAHRSTIVTTKAIGNKQAKETGSVLEDERERLLNPVDRISEILFGLIMAVTIVGSLSIATAGKEEVRTVMMAALGCNLAWGLVDAVMYVVRTATERTRNRVLARRIADADAGMARRLITQALPEHVVALTGPDEIEAMRRRLLASPDKLRPVLAPRDFLEAFAVFLMVVVATFPVVAPFLLTSDAATAMRMSQAVTLGMLFIAGLALGRYAGYAKPLRPALAMAVFGAVLIAAVKALGG
jgi:VIT1/CCC1 family predicted Fe2+/Mn2+ transporter